MALPSRERRQSAKRKLSPCALDALKRPASPLPPVPRALEPDPAAEAANKENGVALLSRLFHNHIRRQSEACITEDAAQVYRKNSQKRFVKARKFEASRSDPVEVEKGCGSCGRKDCIRCCLQYPVALRSKRRVEELLALRRSRTKRRVSEFYDLGPERARKKMQALYNSNKKKSVQKLPAIPELSSQLL